ncbi:unnamed protein product [Phytomonas sp. Hart1]|nr:unnamed protein product [Phytomonas sp. Hart1]|eukprot:CCW65914.1 unnamed protein product [Phytomonas sp. isolate Hart1]
MPPKKPRSGRKKKAPPTVTKSKTPSRRSASVEPETSPTPPQSPTSIPIPIPTPTPTPTPNPIPVPVTRRVKLTSLGKDSKSAAAPRRPFPFVLVVLFLLAVLAGCYLWTVKGPPSVEVRRGKMTTACPCLGGAYSPLTGQGNKAQGALARTFMSAYAPLTGLHVRSDSASLVFNELGFVRSCSIVIHLTKTINNVEELQKILKLPFSRSSCVVWVADINLFERVFNPLKELFEDNTLRGVEIAPAGKKGFLILVSEKSREGLKEDLPHRVVHMLNTVELSNGSDV